MSLLNAPSISLELSLLFVTLPFIGQVTPSIENTTIRICLNIYYLQGSKEVVNEKIHSDMSGFSFCSLDWARTSDPLINSQML